MAATPRLLKAAAITVLSSVMMTGCLLKDASETWYVDANGGVTWVVLEKDVRSDAKAVADRQQEESIYWLAVQQERHPMAMGLQELGGTKLRTIALRDQSPYTVQTEAKFTGLDEIGRRMLAAVGGLGESTIQREGDVCEWTFVIRDPKSLGSTTEPSDNVTALMNEFASLKVVLVTGHFEAAQGFTISNDDRVASFDEKFVDQHDEQQTIAFKLRWKS